MALSETQINLITALVKKGDLSNRQIAKEIGCSESAVRTWIRKNGVEKNALRNLAKEEISNIINAKEIEEKKNALSPIEKTHYTHVLLEEAQANNLYLNVNQKILSTIMDALENGTKDMKINSGDGMQTIQPMRHEPSDLVALARAAQTATDSLGITQRHAPKSENNVAVQNNINSNMSLTMSEDEAKKEAERLGVPLSALI